MIPDSEGYSSKSDLILAAVKSCNLLRTILEMEKRTKKGTNRVRYAWFGGNVIKIKTAKGKREQACCFCCPYLEKKSGNERGLHAFFGQFRVIYF